MFKRFIVINFNLAKNWKLGKVLNLSNVGDKLSNFKVCIGRVEANYIATNPLIFEDFKMGDMLVCMEKDDYFRMQEGITELYKRINKLLSIINDLYQLNPEIMKELRIKQLKKELNELENKKLDP